MAAGITEICLNGRCQSGGIVSLAKVINDHREAISSDLFAITGHQLSDIGKSVSWGTLDTFLRHLPADSAFMRELYPESAPWATTAKTNAILADIFDVLSGINSNLVAIATGKPPREPKRYPRPGVKQQKNENERHFGSGALPAKDLRNWFEEKRRRLCQK